MLGSAVRHAGHVPVTSHLAVGRVRHSLRVASFVVASLSSGCYLGHERSAPDAAATDAAPGASHVDTGAPRDVGVDAGHDAGIDSGVAPDAAHECPMPTTCTDDAITIVLEHTVRTSDDEGCVELDVDAIGSHYCRDGTPTRLNVIRCAEGRISVEVTITRAPPGDFAGLIEYPRGSCACAVAVESYNPHVGEVLPVFVHLEDDGVRQLGLSGHDIGYHVRACAVGGR